MDSGVQLPTIMRFRSAQADCYVGSRQHGSNRGFLLPVNEEPMARQTNAFRPIALGLAVTLLQIFFAVVLFAPEGPLRYRYETLVQHDSFWFANILERGYNTILPP